MTEGGVLRCSIHALRWLMRCSGSAGAAGCSLADAGADPAGAGATEEKQHLQPVIRHLPAARCALLLSKLDPPSRARMQRSIDPIFFAAAPPTMALAPDLGAKAFYEEHGYYIVKNVWPADEAAKWRARLLRRQCTSNLCATFSHSFLHAHDS